MSFNIVLQTNISEKNKLDKSLTTIGTVSGVLKNDTSIINPVFRVAGDLSDYTGCNYMTVEAFGRSYFVTDIRSVNGGFVEIAGHCDVISTYKTQIRTNTAIIHKSENNWNLYLNDGSFKVYQNPFIYAKKFSAGFTTTSYILAVAGS